MDGSCRLASGMRFQSELGATSLVVLEDGHVCAPGRMNDLHG